MRLRVEDVAKHFGGNRVLQSVSFEISEPQICGLIGPNGAGKTTLTNILGGRIKPSAGKIFLGEERIDQLGPTQIARRGLGRTFQIPRPFGRLSVRENLRLPALAAKRMGPGDVETQIDETLALVRLDHLASEQSDALSGGQKKLLELARLVLLGPNLLLLDEPFAGVHPQLQEVMHEFIRTMHARGKAFIIISHEIRTIFELSQRLLVLADGHLIADDVPDVVRHDRKVIEAYLGDEAQDA